MKLLSNKSRNFYFAISVAIIFVSCVVYTIYKTMRLDNPQIQVIEISKKETSRVNKIDQCALPKFVLGNNENSILSIYQTEYCFEHDNYRLDTFKTSLKMSVGDLKNNLKSHFKINAKQSASDHAEHMMTVYRGVNAREYDSFHIISKDFLLITNGIVRRKDFKSAKDSFCGSIGEYIMEKGDEYIRSKIGESNASKMVLYSFMNAVRTSAHASFFHHEKLSNLNEEGLIKEYLDTIHFMNIRHNNYNFSILGNDKLTIQETGINNLNVINYFTINFIIFYPEKK